MHFTKFLSAVLAISMSPLGHATPAPSQELLIKHNQTYMSGNTTMIKPRQGALLDPHLYCVWYPYPLVTAWEISYPNDLKYSKEKCGLALKANIRGFALCQPTMFKCKRLDEDGQVYIKFNTFFGCRASWITEAIRAATNDDFHVDCYPF